MALFQKRQAWLWAALSCKASVAFKADETAATEPTFANVVILSNQATLLMQNLAKIPPTRSLGSLTHELNDGV